MKDTIVSFKTAKLAKEKGFNEICLNHYNIEEWDIKRKPEKGVRNSEIIIGDCTAPTQTILQKWLREKHNIHTNIILEDEYQTYEKALEKDLFEALNLITLKK